MSKRVCKFCDSEMDLMEDKANSSLYVCMNENCNATLTLSEDNFVAGINEEWDEHGGE
jgi:hypothetical protein